MRLGVGGAFGSERSGWSLERIEVGGAKQGWRQTRPACLHVTRVSGDNGG